MKQSDQWVFDARSRPVPPARSPSARAPVSQQHIGGQTNFSWSPPLSKWHPSNIQTQKCWARVLWVAPWLCPIGGWARVWSVIWNWLKSLTLDDSGQAGPRLAPDIGLGQPITGQYSGHVIRLVQSEASVTSDTVVSTQPGPSVRVVSAIHWPRLQNYCGYWKKPSSLCNVFRITHWIFESFFWLLFWRFIID